MGEMTSTNTSNRKWLLIVGMVIVAIVLLMAGFFAAMFVLNKAAGGASAIANTGANVLESVSDAAESVSEVTAFEAQGILAPDRYSGELRNFTIRPFDMDAAYHIDEGDEARISNTGVLYERGQEQGKRYIAATGRVDGWMMEMRRTHVADIAPSIVGTTIEIFATAEGADTAIGTDWFYLYADDLKRKPTMIDDSCDYGSNCQFYVFSKAEPASGLTTLHYEISFTYQNTLVTVYAIGLDYEVSEQDMIDVADTVYAKLQTGTLTPQ